MYATAAHPIPTTATRAASSQSPLASYPGPAAPSPSSSSPSPNFAKGATSAPVVASAARASVAGAVVSSSLAAALVKEFLASKGLVQTLEAFRLEYLQYQKTPITSSRTELSRQLGIGKLLNANKLSDCPLRSQLEVVVKSLCAKASSKSANSASGSIGSINGAGNFTITSAAANNGSLATVPPVTSSSADSQQRQSVGAVDQLHPDRSSPSAVTFRTPLGGFESRNPHATTPTASGGARKTSVAFSTSPASASTRPSSASGKTATTFTVRKGSGGGGTASPGGKRGKVLDDVEITEDFDDDDDDDQFDPTAIGRLSVPSPGGAAGTTISKGVLITTQKALSLRRTTFAAPAGVDESAAAAARGAKTNFGDEWRGKGFVFSSVAEIAYGLVQSKGGPCGLLAAVQAYVIKYLMFGDNGPGTRGGLLRPTFAQSKSALIDAITEILWQAGGTRNRRAVVALYKPALRVASSTRADLSRERYVPDGITENLELHEFSDVTQLRDFMSINIESFMGNDPNRHGIIQLLYSAVLSRGPETIREEDFDEPGCSLIGRHSYCTQELVNLLLIGTATSNVHDGDIRLGGSNDVTYSSANPASGSGGGGGGAGQEDFKLLKGVKRPSQFGFLSLFEHYGSMKVGNYFKNPTSPIFVVCSESHFTVLFATYPIDPVQSSSPPPSSSTLNSNNHHRHHGGGSMYGNNEIELFYYDGLAGQDNEIRLVVRQPHPQGQRKNSAATNAASEPSGVNSLVPPLELVIRTRWEGATVEWHGSDPLL